MRRRRRRRCPCVSVFPVCRQVSAPYAHPPRAPGDTRRRSHGSHPSLVAGWLCRIWGLYVILLLYTYNKFFYDYYYYYFHNRPTPTTDTTGAETCLIYLYTLISRWPNAQNYYIITLSVCTIRTESQIKENNTL